MSDNSLMKCIRARERLPDPQFDSEGNKIEPSPYAGYICPGIEMSDINLRQMSDFAKKSVLEGNKKPQFMRFGYPIYNIALLWPISAIKDDTNAKGLYQFH